MWTDLSIHHKLIGSVFEQPSTAAEWDRYRLTEDQVEFYNENGYIAGIKMLNGHQVDALRQELQALMDPAHPGHSLFYEFHSNESTDASRILFHALGAWRITAGFHDLLWNPVFVMAAQSLLGGPVRFWHDQLFCKPARSGAVVAWHQDYSYWTRTEPMAHLSCWIGLDDSTRQNGCVNYVPGSHRWNLLPITGLAGDMNAIQSVLTPEQKAQFKPLSIELEKGECSFHHPLMVHGSFENLTDTPRRGAVINVFRDGVISKSDQPPLKGVPPIPAGQAMGGQFFPLLSSGSANR
jgi:ectoine hydroxylase-related dioxygenase (phytanoyl-CoA dioxygenase family)